MQNSIALNVLASVSENGFSLDELVYETRRLFEEQGLAGFVGLILSLVDEKMTLDLTRGGGSWLPRRCCSAPRYELQGRLDRRFRTTVGTVHLRWRRVHCTRCGRTCVPLREFLGLERYQSKTAELERVVTEVISEQSYRRTTSHLRLIGEIPVPKSTLHRWVMASDCDEIEFDPADKLKTILADATRYKRRPPATDPKNNRGEIQLIVGVTKYGQVKPLGAWSGKSWEQIGQWLQGNGPLGEVLVTDGDRGLVQGLRHLADGHQRCHWHAVHDLDRILYHEKASLKQRRRFQKSLAAMISISLPQEDFQEVSEEDKSAIEQSVREAEHRLRQLIVELFQRGYAASARYVSNAKTRLFTYVRYWLKYGLVNPRATSMIERMMREIGRRLKRIAFGWSNSGAAKMTRIIIKRITTDGQWEGYWKTRLRIEGNVILLLQSIKTTDYLQPSGQ
jgi:hypothetical protein